MGNPIEAESGEVNAGYVPTTEDNFGSENPPPYSSGIHLIYSGESSRLTAFGFFPQNLAFGFFPVFLSHQNCSDAYFGHCTIDVGEKGTTIDPVVSKNQNPNFQNENDGMKPVRLMSEAEIRKEKMRIWKNVAVISLSFMCLFTAFNSVGNLQVNYFIIHFSN